MTDQRRSLEAEGIEKADGIRGQVHQGICLDVFRLRRLTVSALVIGDRPESGPSEGRDLVPPGEGQLREAVDHDDGVAGAFVDGRELHLVDGVEDSIHTLRVVRRTDWSRSGDRHFPRTQGSPRPIWRLQPAVRERGATPVPSTPRPDLTACPLYAK